MSSTAEEAAAIEQTQEDEYIKKAQSLTDADFTSDDYYLNPLIRNTETIFGDDTLTKMLKSLEAPDGTIPDKPINDELAEILGLKTTGATRVVSTVSDPFYSAAEGKFVRFGRYYITNIEVAQNQSMSGYQDYYEDGRLMGFSISCNDPDMIPVVFVENAVGSKDIINDLSFKEAVIHGRGMTYGEATSLVRTTEGNTTRDVVGQRSNLFPYVARYKDTFTGTEPEYEDIKGTIHDKYYTMNFEPDVFVPYKRLYFDVFNASTSGIRLIHRLEIKRLFLQSVDEYSSGAENDSEFIAFNKALIGLSERFNSKKLTTPQALEQFIASENVVNLVADPTTPPPQQAAAHARIVKKPGNLFEEFIKFMYGKVNEKNVTRAYMSDYARETPTLDRIVINDINTQRQLRDLKKMVKSRDEIGDELIQQALDAVDDDDNTMRVTFT